MVSIELAFNRLRTSTAIVGSPLSRLKPVASLNLRTTLAISPNLTTAWLSLLMGILRISCSVSISAGTLIPKRPKPASISPAGINRLFWLKR